MKFLYIDEPKYISFISASGGVGKTKLALLLAYYITKMKGQRVLLIDMDPTAGASFSVFEDDELERKIIERKTFSYLIKHINEGRNVDLSNYVVQAKISDAYINFLIPGDELVDVVEDFWKGGSAGPNFSEQLRSMVPKGRYNYVIIDTAPFFDPRYTTLSIYVSDYQVIPVTPNIVDMRRNIMMIEKIKNDIKMSIKFKGLETDPIAYMRNRYIAVLNKLPTRTNQAEYIFYETFIHGKQIKTGTNTEKRVKKLLEYGEKLKNYVKFLKDGIKTSEAFLGRFPKEAKGKDCVDIASGYLIKIYDIIKRN